MSDITEKLTAWYPHYCWFPIKIGDKIFWLKWVLRREKITYYYAPQDFTGVAMPDKIIHEYHYQDI